MNPILDNVIAGAAAPAVEPENTGDIAQPEELRQTQQKRKNICVAVTGTVVAFLVGLAKYPDFRAWQDARVFAQIESLSAHATTHGQAVSLLPQISGYSPELFNKSVAHVLGQDHANYTSIAAAMLNLGETRQKYLDQQLKEYATPRMWAQFWQLLNDKQFDEANKLARTMPKEHDRMMAVRECHKAFANNALSQIRASLKNLPNMKKALDLAHEMPMSRAFEKVTAYELILDNLIERITLQSTHAHWIRAISEASKIEFPGEKIGEYYTYDVEQFLAKRARTSEVADIIIPYIYNRKLRSETINYCISHFENVIQEKNNSMVNDTDRLAATQPERTLIKNLLLLRSL